MAGGEHDSGRVHRARHHPAPEAGGRARDCGISVEQDCFMKGPEKSEVRSQKSGAGSLIRILFPTAMSGLLARRKARLTAAEAVVRPILEAVRTKGDKALLEYARRFDALDGKTVAVTAADLQRAGAGLAPEFRDAVEIAAANIRAFARMQLPVETLRE